MWKRENEPGAGTSPSPSPTSAPAATPSTPRVEAESAASPAPRPAAVQPSGERAVLSPSIVLRGEVSGDEDLVVEGRIEGKINLRQNAVTIGAKGRVTAEIHARAIHIEGEVEGNLTAEEQIVLRKSSRVRGDLSAPRVTIEDGARFRGAIDMEAKQRPAGVHAAPAAPRPANVKEESAPRPVEPKSTAQAG
jgi:cytoskeletal protein CcmA (bactofilin family)